MKIINKTLLIIITILLLNSCSGFKLKKKSSSGEEFLIEKKDPLILPPDYSGLPKPNEQNDQSIEGDDQTKLETIFNDDSSKNDIDDKESESELKDSVLKKFLLIILIFFLLNISTLIRQNIPKVIYISATLNINQ